jgi:hypothetical protein
VLVIFQNRCSLNIEQRVQATEEGARLGARFALAMLGWGKELEAGSVVAGAQSMSCLNILLNCNPLNN